METASRPGGRNRGESRGGPGRLGAGALFAIGAVLALAFATLAGAVEARLLTGLDTLARPLRGTPETVGASIFGAVTRLGDPEVVVLLTMLVAGVALIARRPADAAIVALTSAAARLTTVALKLGFERTRPQPADPIETAASFAFPSGHSSAAAALYGAVALLVLRSGLPRVVRVVATVMLGTLIGAVAFSRVYLGVHHFTDVVGGLLVGFACLAASAALIEAVQGRPRVRDGGSSARGR